jgi:hypothetical protein
MLHAGSMRALVNGGAEADVAAVCLTLAGLDDRHGRLTSRLLDYALSRIFGSLNRVQMFEHSAFASSQIVAKPTMTR